MSDCPECGCPHEEPGIVATLCDHPCHYRPAQGSETTARHLMEPDRELGAPDLKAFLWWVAFLLMLVYLVILLSLH